MAGIHHSRIFLESYSQSRLRSLSQSSWSSHHRITAEYDKMLKIHFVWSRINFDFLLANSVSFCHKSVFFSDNTVLDVTKIRKELMTDCIALPIKIASGLSAGIFHGLYVCLMHDEHGWRKTSIDDSKLSQGSMIWKCRWNCKTRKWRYWNITTVISKCRKFETSISFWNSDDDTWS